LNKIYVVGQSKIRLGQIRIKLTTDIFYLHYGTDFSWKFRTIKGVDGEIIDYINKMRDDVRMKRVQKWDKYIQYQSRWIAFIHYIIDKWWPVNILVSLSTVPRELVNLQLCHLLETSMIIASNYMFMTLSMLSVVHAKEDQRETSVLEKKYQVFCSPKCHKNSRCC